ncbi:MAG: tRNA (adenosine(37)-N6)-threonylcarbamoyltransferase complex transferase subunit TsaD [Simkaniaceae bacterium]|nr:tRNA (adenosine(37)-N6)-threonylcarbamoyltransferase complex transferase subunit TsaD [Simkaniaceae bacterium]
MGTARTVTLGRTITSDKAEEIIDEFLWARPCDMNVLGLETSCDETSVAVVRGGNRILFHVIASQERIHARYGGVFPELASREHVDRILPLVEKAEECVSGIDLVAVANGPGLIGSLLMGTTVARTLAYGRNLPLVGVNHVDAHLYAAMMTTNEPPPMPALGIVVSGGHTFLAKVTSIGNYSVIGTTVDDAAGEAFDKVATLLGYPYPGGPRIEKLAEGGDPFRYDFKAGRVKGRPLDFSFSGLKTNVLYAIKGQNGRKDDPVLLGEREKRDVAASFQRVALSDIVTKSMQAARTFDCKAIVAGGGVVNNRYLRNLLCKHREIPVFFPPPELSADNAAMIAGLGYVLHARGMRSDPFRLPVFPRMNR